ncbi:hypothetical protein EWU23_09690 [Cytophagaceae bacterium 50C-KIRBA]|uniref:Uncharacterized protein n=1 Tax=Aquirufa beregesia TaxID=2516556 RepID=A0ABX0EWB9_9BACT|nr:hypothetical protein [Aquirufa beregesia]NGZ44749.1 hypothetical protein [Aquirufa beregesia]
MPLIYLYQTLENRGNEEDILLNGPFICRRNTSWLGDGYYFWDGIIENAHWWGEVGYKVKGSDYVITKGCCDFDFDTCFDLVGWTEHLNQFKQAVDLMNEMGLIDSNVTVRRVIEYIKNKTQSFNYQAIRACGVLTRSEKSEMFFQMKFNVKKVPYLDLTPPIQLCLFDKGSLNFRNYEVIDKAV